MNQKPISFNDLPEAISEVLKRISRIEEIISVPTVPEQGDELLNAKQAAEFLQIAMPTLYAKVRQIPHIKKHKRLVFHRSELLEYLNSGRRKTSLEQEISTINEVDSLLAKAGKRKRRKA